MLTQPNSEDGRRCLERGHVVCEHCGACENCRRKHQRLCPNGPEVLYQKEREAAKARGVRVLPTWSDRTRIVKRQEPGEMTDQQLKEAKALFDKLSEERKYRGRPRKQRSVDATDSGS